jgi:hypothetical protein
MNLTISDEMHARLERHAAKVPKLNANALAREPLAYGLGRLDEAEDVEIQQELEAAQAVRRPENDKAPPLWRVTGLWDLRWAPY